MAKMDATQRGVGSCRTAILEPSDAPAPVRAVATETDNFDSSQYEVASPELPLMAILLGCLSARSWNL